MGLADADVGKQFAVWLAITNGIVTVVRIDDDDVERFQFIQRSILAVKQRNSRRVGEYGCQRAQTQQQNEEHRAFHAGLRNLWPGRDPIAQNSRS